MTFGGGIDVALALTGFFYLLDGKMHTFSRYVVVSVMLAQMGVNPEFAGAVAPAAGV